MAFKKSCYSAILAAIILLSAVSPALAADDAPVPAKKAEGKYTSINYPSEINTADLIKGLSINASDKVLTGTPLAKKTSDENELAASLDSLFIQVSDILDMRPYNLKINIKVCRSQDELKDLYNKMFAASLGNQRSFYSYDSGTIYLSVDNFRREIIGHELSHAIISHYFVIPAPVKIQEVLSMYVEYNLRHTENNQ
jgi:hypothetical protein